MIGDRATDGPRANLHDHAGFFEQRHECRREHETGVRILPAQESLHAGHRESDGIDLRLVIQHEFFPFQRASQAVLQRDPLAYAFGHVRPVEQHALAVGFRGLECRLGVSKQRIGIAAIGRIERDAEARGNVQFTVCNPEWPRRAAIEMRFDHLVQGFGCRLARQGDHESIRSQSRDLLRSACATEQPFSKLDEEQIAALAPQRVVEVLEMIEIRDAQRDGLSLALRLAQHGDQAIVEQ